jgi:hypothetical protein
MTIQEFLNESPNHGREVLAHAEQKRILSILSMGGIQLPRGVKAAIEQGTETIADLDDESVTEYDAKQIAKNLGRF